MCGCCWPSQREETSAAEAQEEPEEKPKSLEERVAELEKAAADLTPVASR